MQDGNSRNEASEKVDARARKERLLHLLLAADRKRQGSAQSIRSAREAWIGRIPLSYAQERLWFLDQVGLVGAAYNSSLAARLSGELNEEALERSFAELVRRHESLRTRFGVEAGVPHQLIDPAGPIQLDRADFSCVIPAEQREQQLIQFMQREQRRPFDLSSSAPMRVMLVKLDEREHVLLLIIHHIVWDGWSEGVLVNEFGVLYSAYVQRQASPLAELSIQYVDYALWQRQLLQGETLNEQVRYWSERLRGAPSQLQLPTDRPRPAIQRFSGAEVRFDVPATFVGSLNKLAREEGATLFMVCLAAFSVLLSSWSGQQDIVVGTPVAGRRHRETERLIGCFVNTLALRVDASPDLTFRQLLRRVKELTLEAYAHQDLPFERLVAELRPERSLSQQPIFQVMLTLQNYPREQVHLPALTWTWVETEGVDAQFDLTLHLIEDSEAISGIFLYATELFDRETIERLAGRLRLLMEGVVSDPDRIVYKLPPLGRAERHQVLVNWNATEAAFCSERLIHELFERQVERTPDAIALVFEERSLTYAELNSRANRLARHLISKGVTPEQLVALCLERGLQLVVGVLGVLKSGAAYIPLDPDYPADRLKYMLEDAAARVLLTQQSVLAKLLPVTQEVVTLDSDSNYIRRGNDGNLNSSLFPLNSRQLAYVIYTSGSTGRPKGVMVEHISIVNFLCSMRRSLGIAVADSFLALTTVSFDIAGLELFLPLVTGAKVVLAGRRVARDASLLMATLEESGITVLQATPATWQSLLSAGWTGRSNLKALCGGEGLSPSISRDLIGRVGVLWNLYGPTETTIWSCIRQITLAAERGVVEAIGHPIANTQVYILDRHLQPVPIGSVGEIYIAGTGMARGYLKRPELTAQRFIANAFSGNPPTRMYKTGDLGRWSALGTLECLGRNDHQVKIRGYRIELGEIESALLDHRGVEQAVVVAHEYEPGERRLVAYVVGHCNDVSTPGTDADPAPDAACSIDPVSERDTNEPSEMGSVQQLITSLREHLKGRLPEYMIPSNWIMLKELPLTPNGKVDRTALPIPRNRPDDTGLYLEPRTEVEKALSEIWTQILHVDRVGIHDNFFELGGHSLSGMKLIAKITERCMVHLPVVAVFQCPTIQSMAELIESLRPSSEESRNYEPEELEQGEI